MIVHGRFLKPGTGVLKLKGKSFGRETVREIPVNFPDNQPDHDVLATLWARTRIDNLTSQDYANNKPEIKDTITNLGIEYRLMTQFTSFVAVEERVVTDGGQPRKIEVPVEMPEGVSRAGVFGEADQISTVTNTTGSNISAEYFSNLPAARSVQGLYTISGGRGRSGLRDARKNQKSPAVGGSSGPENSYILDGRSGDEKSAAVGVIRAKSLPKPVYPSTPITSNANRVVNVEVALDIAGNVITAKSLSGNSAFLPAVEAAASNTKFDIPKVSFEIAKITGVISYNFAIDKTVTASEALQNVRIDLKPNKYHSTIRALVERLKATPSNPGAGEERFVKDGKASVVVRLKALSPETVDTLKKLGFEVLTEMPSANAVVGKIPIGQIAALAGLDSVTFISPQY